ncbi:TIGR02186 family protein [Desulfobacterium sp. N47]|uniref:Transmembrane protein n=1 Tax=uncultured Desulfobacterium sp. TaxID=201089 RepID=E1YES4_9BACT|nr:hypothetical protein N47_J00490 [uncultured Desulfobacterium sp.]
MNLLLLKRPVYLFFIVLLVPAVFICVSHAQNSPVGVDVIQPKTIQIKSTFSGGKITVRSVIPAQDKVALRLIGPKQNLALMRKDRVKGLWMNVEQIHFKDIPNIYLLWTSKDLSSLENRENLKVMKLDYVSLLADSLPETSADKEPDKSVLINELIKLKEADNLFKISDGTVSIRPSEQAGWNQIDAVLDVPSKIAPGTYTLDLVALKDGKGTLLQSSEIKVKLAGVPAIISNLAFKKGLLYGILAVIIATFSGLLIGIIFESKGSH